LLSDHKNRRINAGYQLWALLTLFLWLKKWNIETGASVSYSPAEISFR